MPGTITTSCADPDAVLNASTPFPSALSAIAVSADACRYTSGTSAWGWPRSVLAFHPSGPMHMASRMASGWSALRYLSMDSIEASLPILPEPRCRTGRPGERRQTAHACRRIRVGHESLRPATSASTEMTGGLGSRSPDGAARPGESRPATERARLATHRARWR